MGRGYYEPGGKKSYNDGQRILINSIFKPIEARSKVSTSDAGDPFQDTKMTPLCWFFLVVSALFELVIAISGRGILSFVGLSIVNVMTTLMLMLIVQPNQNKGSNVETAALTGIVGAILSLIALFASERWFAGFVDYFIMLFLVTGLSSAVFSLNDIYTSVAKRVLLVVDIAVFVVLVSTDSIAVSLFVALLYVIVLFSIKALFGKSEGEE